MFKRNKAVKNAKEVIFNGIKFRSSLELYCYKRLKQEGFDFTYEPKDPIVLIERSEFKGRWIEPNNKNVFCEANTTTLPKRYTPDFVDNNGGWIIETKGWQAADNWEAKRKLIRTDLKNADIWFFVPRTQADIEQSIRILQGKLEPLPSQTKKRATKKINNHDK